MKNTIPPAHDYQFDVVWEGRWYRLASLSQHLTKGIDPTGPKWLLVDSLYREVLVSRSEVHLPPKPLSRQ